VLEKAGLFELFAGAPHNRWCQHAYICADPGISPGVGYFQNLRFKKWKSITNLWAAFDAQIHHGPLSRQASASMLTCVGTLSTEIVHTKKAAFRSAGLNFFPLNKFD
jgi:hypothetical protein